MKKNSVALFLIGAFFVGFTEDGNLHRVFAVKAPKECYLTVDKLGNAYLVGKFDIKKIDVNQNITTNYSERGNGPISYADFSNPMKPYILFGANSVMVILDSKFSVDAVYDWRKVGFEWTSLVCFSYNNCIWLYDRQDFELKRIDLQFQITHRTGNIALLAGYDINPNQVLEFNNFVYLNDPKAGIFVFDVYGTFLKKLPGSPAESIQTVDGGLLLSNKTEKGFVMRTIDMLTLREDTIALPKAIGTQSRNLRINGRKIYNLTQDSLVLYTF